MNEDREFDPDEVSVPDDVSHGWLDDYAEAELPYVESHIMHPGGVVHLVGAGPGEADLISVRGRMLLEQANVIVHDSEVDAALLQRSGEPAELHVVSPDDTESSSAEEVGSLLVRLAREGKAVVRLLAGDPFAFGRGALEAQALAGSGVAFTVVPGIPEAIAAPARAGIPLTSEGLSSQLAGWQAGGSDLAFIIGGPDGVSADCARRADFRWSLSRLTLPHGLARVVLAEQLYRAHTLLQGHPYHRA